MSNLFVYEDTEFENVTLNDDIEPPFPDPMFSDTEAESTDVLSCTSCNGNGEVPANYAGCYGSFEDVITCLTCHGTGFVHTGKFAGA